MTASPSDTVKRTSEVLKTGASSQILDYEHRFPSLKNIYDDLLINLIRTDFGYSEACATALKFFGSPNVRFAGIDGTMYSRPLFDLVVGARETHIEKYLKENK